MTEFIPSLLLNLPRLWNNTDLESNTGSCFRVFKCCIPEVQYSTCVGTCHFSSARHMMAAFSVRWKHSTSPLVAGWWAGQTRSGMFPHLQHCTDTWKMGLLRKVRMIYDHFSKKQKEQVVELLNLLNTSLMDWWGRTQETCMWPSGEERNAMPFSKWSSRRWLDKGISLWKHPGIDLHLPEPISVARYRGFSHPNMIWFYITLCEHTENNKTCTSDLYSVDETSRDFN